MVSRGGHAGVPLKSVALANQKGGVGKTTSAIHLAHGLALAGKRVAIVDLDPQGNATLAVQGMRPATTPPSEGPLASLRMLSDGLWLLPSPGAERNLAPGAVPDQERLRALVTDLEGEGIDWLIVDCPPRMDVWGWTGLRLCEAALLPVQAEFFAMHGLSQMLDTHEKAAAEGPCGRLMGVLVTMLQTDEQVSLEVLDDLRKNLGSRLFQSVVFRDSQFVEAASHGLSLFDYNLDAKGARSYGELVREVLYGQT